MHQDEFHRRNFDSKWVNVNNDRTYVVCITAIDEMTEENGGIKVFPSSHKIGRVLSNEELNALDLKPGDTI